MFCVCLHNWEHDIFAKHQQFVTSFTITPVPAHLLTTTLFQPTSITEYTTTISQIDWDNSELLIDVDIMLPPGSFVWPVATLSNSRWPLPIAAPISRSSHDTHSSHDTCAATSFWTNPSSAVSAPPLWPRDFSVLRRLLMVSLAFQRSWFSVVKRLPLGYSLHTFRHQN